MKSAFIIRREEGEFKLQHLGAKLTEAKDVSGMIAFAKEIADTRKAYPELRKKMETYQLTILLAEILIQKLACIAKLQDSVPDTVSYMYALYKQIMIYTEEEDADFFDDPDIDEMLENLLSHPLPKKRNDYSGMINVHQLLTNDQEIAYYGLTEAITEEEFKEALLELSEAVPSTSGPLEQPKLIASLVCVLRHDLLETLHARATKRECPTEAELLCIVLLERLKHTRSVVLSLQIEEDSIYAQMHDVFGDPDYMDENYDEFYA